MGHLASDEATTVAMVRELRGKGRSLRDICDALTTAGRQTKRGGRWSPKVVRAILLRYQAA